MVTEKMASDSVKSEVRTSGGSDYATGEVTTAHVSPELEKRFSFLSTIGINFSLTSTPLSIGSYLSVAIGVGGSPVFAYGYLVAVSLNLIVCASLAEIAATLPHSSGKSMLLDTSVMSSCYQVDDAKSRYTYNRTNVLDRSPSP